MEGAKVLPLCCNEWHERWKDLNEDMSFIVWMPVHLISAVSRHTVTRNKHLKSPAFGHTIRGWRQTAHALFTSMTRLNSTSHNLHTLPCLLAFKLYVPLLLLLLRYLNTPLCIKFACQWSIKERETLSLISAQIVMAGRYAVHVAEGRLTSESVSIYLSYS